MKRWYEGLGITARMAAVVVLAGLTAQAWGEVTYERIKNADKYPGDWLTYHGSYRSWHYSALDQINTKNVSKLQVGWTHSMPRAMRGLQSMPLAAEGILYYSGPYNQVFALDGSTGEVIWYYRQKMNEDLVARQTHSPYNRGIALGMGNVYMGTLDGKLVAIDMKTGKLNWETKLLDSERLTGGFHRRAIVRQGQGHHRFPGRRVAVPRSALRRRRQHWPGGVEVYTVGGNDGTKSDARNTWGTTPGRPVVAAAGCRSLRPRHQHRLVGDRQPGSPLRLVRSRLDDRGAPVREPTCTRPRWLVWISTLAS
jgi:hypothetical protein